METVTLKLTSEFGFGKFDIFTNETSIAPRPNVTPQATTATQTTPPSPEIRHDQTTSRPTRTHTAN